MFKEIHHFNTCNFSKRNIICINLDKRIFNAMPIAMVPILHPFVADYCSFIIGTILVRIIFLR